MMIPADTIPRVEHAFKLAQTRFSDPHPLESVHCNRLGVCISTTKDGGMFVFKAYKSHGRWSFKPIGGIL